MNGVCFFTSLPLNLGRIVTAVTEHRKWEVPVLTRWLPFPPLASQSLYMITLRPPYCEKAKSHGEMRGMWRERKRERPRWNEAPDMWEATLGHAAPNDCCRKAGFKWEPSCRTQRTMSDKSYFSHYIGLRVVCQDTMASGTRIEYKLPIWPHNEIRSRV